MALYDPKEFAEKINKPTNYLSVYIGRGKIIVREDGKIDDTDAKNAAFLQKQLAKNAVKGDKIEEPAVVYEAKLVKEDTKKGKPTEEIDTESVNYAALDKKKLQLDVKKKEEEVEKLKLINAKARGEVIPFELMGPLVARFSKNLASAYRNAAEELISDMAKKKSFTNEERAALNKKMLETINDAVRVGTDMTKKDLKIIVEDYKGTIK